MLKTPTKARLQAAAKAAITHFSLSLLVAALAAALVFGFWFPGPYREMAGGRELFWLVVSVDVVCGPLLTLVLFNPGKPRAELWRDLTLVAVIQLAALVYGVWTVWEVRPLFLVQEVDRFKVVNAADLRGASTAELATALQPGWLSGPVTVAIRPPKDTEERSKVLFESLQGGRDYAERPEFYLPYEGSAALRSLDRARPLAAFLIKQPAQQPTATALAKDKNVTIEQWLYLPIRARQDWIAVLDKQGQIQGFLKGDGF